MKTPGLSLAARTGLISSIGLAIITILTFGLAIRAVPVAGPFCPENCLSYPYSETFTQYPRDYFWMFPALLMLIFYFMWMISMHYLAPAERKIFSHSALLFSLMSVLLLFTDYFLQFSVIPVSQLNNEQEGVALLSQYNPHGVFIVLEEAGYILMSISFLFMALVFSGTKGSGRILFFTFITAFILTIVSLAGIAVKFGLEREYRFEVIVISITWLSLIIGGIASAFWFWNHRD